MRKLDDIQINYNYLSQWTDYKSNGMLQDCTSTVDSQMSDPELLNQIYESVGANKSIQAISVAIRQFVMEKFDTKKRQQIASQYLNFFLNCERKLKYKSDQEWDITIRRNIQWIDKLIKLNEFPSKSLIRKSFNLLKAIESQKNDQVQITQFTCSVPIQDDVRLKTQYFMKWCEYLMHAKKFKKIKQEEIINVQKSLQFNNYGIMFSYFSGWKKFTKKRKTQKSKMFQLNQLINVRAIKRSFSKIHSIIQVLKIQNILANRVQKCLKNFKKKQTLKKLKLNRVLIKKQTSKNKCINIWSYRFLNRLISCGRPTHNKSYVNSRKKYAKNFENNLLQICFKNLKSQVLIKRNKIQKVKQVIKVNEFTILKRILKDKLQMKAKRISLKQFVQKKRKKLLIIILSIKKTMNDYQKNRIKELSNKKGSVVDNKLLLASQYKAIKEKGNYLQNIVDHRNCKQFYQQINSYLHNRNQLEHKQFKVIQIMKKRLFQNNKRNKEYVQECVNQIQYTDKWYRNTLMRRAFQGIIDIKCHNEQESRALDRICRIGNRVVQQKCYNRLICTVYEKQCIQKLQTKILNIIKKQCLVRLCGKTKLINTRVDNYKIKSNKKLMKNLFTLLITNKQHNNKLNSVLQESLKHYNKINFLKNIKNNYKFNSKENMIVKNKKKYQIHKLYSQLSSAYKYNKEMQEKVIFCSKKYFIINMQKSMIKTYIHNDDLQCKSVQLQNKIGEIQKIRFFKQLNIKYKYHHKQYNKSYQILTKNITKSIHKIRNTHRLIKQQQQTKHKQQKLIHYLLERKFSELLEGKKVNSIKNILTSNNKHRFINNISEKYNQHQHIVRSTESLTNFTTSSTFNQFIDIVRYERKEHQHKLKLLTILEKKRQKENKKNLFNCMTAGSQHNTNCQQLKNKIKHKQFSQFATLVMKKKFNQIKLHISLKHYAKNILHMGLKALKRHCQRSKHKQNMVFIGKNSSFKMEKSKEKHQRSYTICEQIQRVNMRKSRQLR